ncbi:HAD-like domain-containing protein [Podospora aff. communis PSN243]|uniref:HAD-like domain-containing protein n=1 Tax=Podospora aff. communis PSN243 TaxID=3040156 RepID=A0AAV9G641_9PEZI|nr:HAD-like domain-containing protein [Podospora aff. communis PSN243]
MTPPDLTTFKALSFDCYGTLIDWENGLIHSLSPILSLLPASHPWTLRPLSAVEHFNAHSSHLWATQPLLPYDANLTQSFLLLAREAGVTLPESVDASEIGSAPGRWPAFEDSVAALQTLKRFYKLIILSNVNNGNIARTVKDNLAPVVFDGVYTAEEIGSYKPSLENFRYLFEHAKMDFGVDKEKGELLHVARSLTADHVPAKEVGLRSVFIARGGDRREKYGTGGDLEELTREGKLGFEWKFDTLGEFAAEVERQFAAKGEA